MCIGEKGIDTTQSTLIEPSIVGSCSVMAALGWMILWMRHVLPVGPVVRGEVFTTICTIHNSRKFHTKSDCCDFDARLGNLCDRMRRRGCCWDDVRQGRALPAHVCAVCVVVSPAPNPANQTQARKTSIVIRVFVERGCVHALTLSPLRLHRHVQPGRGGLSAALSCDGGHAALHQDRKVSSASFARIFISVFYNFAQQDDVIRKMESIGFGAGSAYFYSCVAAHLSSVWCPYVFLFVLSQD